MPILPSERTENRYRIDKRASIATTPNQTHGGRAERGDGNTRRPPRCRQHSQHAASGQRRSVRRRVPSAAPTTRDRLVNEHRSTLDNMLHRQTDTTPILIILVFALLLTFTLWRSIGFIMVPWKNSTVVKCLLNRPSSSRSGGFLSWTLS